MENLIYESNVKSQDTVEENVKDRISDNSDASSNAGDAENMQLGGVSFEIIDRDTVKALINALYILTRATDIRSIIRAGSIWQMMWQTV